MSNVRVVSIGNTVLPDDLVAPLGGASCCGGTARRDERRDAGSCVRNILDRRNLAFLNPSGTGDRVKLLEHPNMEIERVFRCTGCGMHIAVGPCFEHIDPESFLGCVCGCATPEPLESPDAAVEAAGRRGTAADEVANA